MRRRQGERNIDVCLQGTDGNVGPSVIIWAGFDRPEVRKLLLFYFLLFLDLKLENYYFFTFLIFFDLKLENYYFFTFLLFLDLKLVNYSVFTFLLFLDLKLENYSIFRWRSARLQ